VQRIHSTRWSRLVRCMLVVAAWQAPLPFWHNHGTLANATQASTSWLADHLRTHHAAIDPFSQFVFGWHLHFALPESGDETPDSPKPARQPGVIASGLTSWDSFVRLQEPIASGVWHPMLIVPRALAADRMLNGVRRTGGFFTDFAPDMPLPVRLGILRC
jgi:hypothetical protein